MTPTAKDYEKAKELCEQVRTIVEMGGLEATGVRTAIFKIVADALEYERERCAGIADRYEEECNSSSDHEAAGMMIASSEIAKKIRSLE